MDHLQDLHFSDLNAICHAGGYFSIEAHTVWSHTPHRFAQHKFYYICDGTCTIHIEGKDYPGTPGRWFFIPAGTLHGYANGAERPFSKFWMHFDLMPQEMDLFAALKLPYFVDVGKENPDALFSAFARMAHSTELTEKLQVKAILLELLSAYIRRARQEPVYVSGLEEERFQAILRFIRMHLRSELSNGMLAQMLHMDSRHFIRYFKQMTGYTPAKYVTVKRMEVAKNLLEESELTISEIMEQVGLQDLSHFSKLFKKYYSLSPRAYRELIQQAVPPEERNR